MMREILFRGKRTDNGEWVYGSLVYWPGDNKIGTIVVFEKEDEAGFVFGDHIEVDLDTVGQFTGLTDANGKKIFEGDILRTRRYEEYTEELKGYHGYDDEGYPIKLPGYTGSMTVHKQRANDDARAVVQFSPTRGFYIYGASVCVNAICNTVIGNIHDNPELLKEKDV